MFSKNKSLNFFVWAGISLFSAFFLFWVFCLNHVGLNEVGIALNSSNGQLTIQTNLGWYVSNPLVKVVNLDTAPQRVELMTSAKVVNVKIVRFKPEPEAIKHFIALHGFSYNLGTSLQHTLMGYAFSGQDYDFYEIIQEAGSGNPPKTLK